MPEVADVIVDPFTQETLPLELPLSYRTDPEAAKNSLGLPAYVDISDPVVAHAVAMLHALSNDLPNHPICFLGGVAFRLQSPSSNSNIVGLRRTLHDIDLCCHHADSKKLLTALLGLSTAHGSALSMVETHSDRMFNALMGGQRLRLHYVDRVEHGHGVLGTVDLIADEFRFCHTLDLTPDIDRASATGRTLGFSTLLLTKLQYIQSIPEAHSTQVPGRVLGPFGKKEVLIGPEEKDVQDAISLLLDRSVGEGPDEISPSRFIGPLASEWGFWTTVRLNLGHLVRSPIVDRLGPDSAAIVRDRVRALQEATERVRPKRRFGFLKREWWEPVESVGAPAGGEAPI